ncbi:MAG: AsmA-like C-terminal region-containing protein [Methanococcaceae archaeon]
MKKSLKIGGIVIGIIIILMLIIPFLFKDKIAGIVKKEANKRINATLDFESAGLNLFSHFPDLTLSLDNLVIVNKAPFAGDTLLKIGSFKAAVNLWSYLKNSQINIENISLVDPAIHINILKDSSANYNIMADTVTQKKETTDNKEMNIALKKYSIENGNILYTDQTSGNRAVIQNLNHQGSGNFAQSIFTIETETTIDSLTFESKGIPLLNKASIKLDMDIEANMPEKKFTLKNNELHVNNLVLKFDGSISRQDTTSTDMDMTFSTVKTDFKDIVSLIPVSYAQKTEDLTASGKMMLNGHFKGVYSKKRLPEFNIKLTVENGAFKYVKYPAAMKDVNLDLQISNPGGLEDNTVIDMKKLHFSLAGEPFDAGLLLKNPRTNPFFNTWMKGRLNLKEIKNLMPLEGVTVLDGLVQADFRASGTVADAKSKKLGNIAASGNVLFNNIVYGTKKLPEVVKISQGLMTLTPRAFNIQNFNVTIGQSDIRVDGGLNNLPGFIINNGLLSGTMNVTSNYFNLNPLMGGKEKVKSAGTGDSTKVKAVEIPDNIDFSLNSNFYKLIYDNLTLENVKGLISIRNSTVFLNNLSSDMLGGNIVISGFYRAPKGNTPNINFNMAINNFNISKTYESFVSVKQFVPMAQYIKGSFGAKLNMSSRLTNSMQPVWNSFNSGGNLNLQRAEVSNFKAFEMVGNALKIDEIKHPVIANVNPAFQIKNGRFTISPFSYKVAGYDVTLAGSNGIDKTLDYVMGVKIPAGNLKSSANNALSQILKKDVSLVKSDNIEVNALIKGNINSPVVTTTAKDIAGTAAKEVTTQIKEEANKQIEQKKQEIKSAAQQKADSLKKKLQKDAENKLRNIFK